MKSIWIRAFQNKNQLGRWNLRPLDFALCLCMIICGAFLITSIALEIFQRLSDVEIDAENPTLTSMIVSGAAMQFGGLFGAIAFIKLFPSSDPENPWPLFRSLAAGFVMFVAASVLVITVGIFWRQLLCALGHSAPPQTLVVLYSEGGTTVEMILTSLMIVAVAPICEEYIFRGIVFRFLQSNFPLWISLLTTSGLFAWVHANLYSSVPLFVLSIGMCLIYRRTGNLLSCMITHSLFNSLSIAFIIFDI